MGTEGYLRQVMVEEIQLTRLGLAADAGHQSKSRDGEATGAIFSEDREETVANHGLPVWEFTYITCSYRREVVYD
jgi:hypothetical protein